MLTTCMLMTCIRTDQCTLDASVSHRFEVNALIGENITELDNRSSSVLSGAVLVSLLPFLLIDWKITLLHTILTLCCDIYYVAESIG